MVCYCPQVAADIAYDPVTNTLYAVTLTGLFGTIDMATGVFNLLSSPFTTLNSLAFGPNGELYAASDVNDELYTVDPGTGALTSLGSMGTGAFAGGDFWWVNGNVYLTTANEEVVQVDPVTPSNSFIVGGTVSVLNLFGMATIGDCPGTVICGSDNDVYTLDMSTLAFTVLCIDVFLPFAAITGAAPLTNGGAGGVQASFTYTLAPPCAPSTVQPLNTGGGVSWAWDFGDGSPSVTGQQPSHVYTVPGTYTITLIATDTGACAGTDTTTQVVFVGGGVGPVAAFTVQPALPCGSNEVLIDDQSTGSGLVLEWDMGDGSTLNGTITSYTYATANAYTITLVVTDTACGGADTLSLPVNLNADLAVELGPDTMICAGEEALLTASAPGATFTWSTGQTSPVISAGEGTYWVVAEIGGCTGSDTISINTLVPVAIGSPAPICSGDSAWVQLPTDWSAIQWSTGDTSVAVFFSEAGVYDYVATTADGCPAAGTIALVVNDADAQLYAPNAFTPNGDGINDVFAVVGSAEDAHLAVFDRWGELIFNGEIMTWDGSYKGAAPKEDVYVYTLNYRSLCRTGREELVGHVTILP